MRKQLASVVFATLMSSIFAFSAMAEGDVNRGKEIYQACVACHSEDGGGNQSLEAPRISGQSAWYLERQLVNFKQGIRGNHLEDIGGLLMRPMAVSLVTEKDIKDVVSYVVTLGGRGKHQDIKGNTQAGKAAYATCVSCHGVDGRGNKALNAPKIAGLPSWYIERQLQNFKKGIRGTNAKDIYGMQMRPMAMTLVNDQAVKDVALYASKIGAQPVAQSGSAKASTIATLVVTPVDEPLYAPCASCHGSNGEGNQKLGAPRLAGQNSWYIERQLDNWRKGIRGTHSEDVFGVQMRPMAMTLMDDNDLKKVVAFISGLNAPAAKATLKGDANAGKNSYVTCIACHGPTGEGNKALNAPKIAGLPDWYIARQLKGFKKGIRGTHQGDVFGMQMRPMAMTLADDNTINNVSSYIATFSGGSAKATETVAETTTEAEPAAETETETEPAAAAVAGSADAGKGLYAVCVSCHAADGAGNKALNAPRLAGQEEWYLARQLANFKSGLRGSHSDDTFGQQMRPMALTLASEKSIADVSAYITTLTGAASAPTAGGDATAGKAAYAVCASCHGVNGEGNKALNAPSLVGQQDWYVVRQLENFKKGVRGADSKDTYGQQMRPMALTLADETAMKNVAAYIATFK